jgi:DNA-binding response OmpR family regulator
MLPAPAHVDRWSAPTKLVLSETLLKEETERVPRDRTEETAISFGPFRLLPKARLLEKDGAPVHVGGRALDVLILLAQRPGEIVGKRELVERVWADVNVDEGSLRFHVTALRKARAHRTRVML